MNIDIENIIVLSIVALAAGSVIWKVCSFIYRMKKASVSCNNGCDC